MLGSIPHWCMTSRCVERVVDFDHVDGSSDLSCVSGDDEGFARPRVGHDFSGARVLEGGFLADLFSIVAFL